MATDYYWACGWNAPQMFPHIITGVTGRAGWLVARSRIDGCQVNKSTVGLSSWKAENKWINRFLEWSRPGDRCEVWGRGSSAESNSRGMEYSTSGFFTWICFTSPGLLGAYDQFVSQRPAYERLPDAVLSYLSQPSITIKRNAAATEASSIRWWPKITIVRECFWHSEHKNVNLISVFPSPLLAQQLKTAASIPSAASAICLTVRWWCLWSGMDVIGKGRNIGVQIRIKQCEPFGGEKEGSVWEISFNRLLAGCCGRLAIIHLFVHNKHNFDRNLLRYVLWWLLYILFLMAGRRGDQTGIDTNHK